MKMRKSGHLGHAGSLRPRLKLCRIICISTIALLTQQAYHQEASPSLARCQPSGFTLKFAIKFPRHKGQLTSIDVFVDKLWVGALYRISSRLSLELAADVSRATLVEGSLECVALPSKEIVPVLGVSSSASVPRSHDSATHSGQSSVLGSLNSRVTGRVYEGLAAIFRPDIRVIKRRRVPHYFVHELREAHGVC